MMMSNNDEKRWSEEERNALIEIRKRLKAELEIQAPFPEGYNFKLLQPKLHLRMSDLV